MKRLINSTTILSLALYVVPPFAAAQDYPKVIIDGTEVICLPDKKAECPEGAFCVVVKQEKNCEAKAADALAAAAAEASAVADKDAADAAAAADTAAAASTEAAATAADATGTDKAAADQAAADALAAEQAAAEKAAADQAAADQAAADQAAAEDAAKQAAADQAAAAADQAAADKAAADQAAVTAEPTAKTDAAIADWPTVTVNGQVFICLPDKDAVCPDGASCVVAKTLKRCEIKAEAKMAGISGETQPPVMTEVPAEDAAAVAAAQAAAAEATAAAATDPSVEVIDAPVPTDTAVETLETALDTPATTDETAPPVEVEATPVVVDGEAGTLPADLAPSDDATVTTEVVTEADTRASTEEFAAAPATVAPGKKTGLSDFEKVGLVALGALVVGAIINNNKQVVSNSGDRVVVRQPDGTYQVYKDDNALLREPGSTVRTETFNDGSTRTIVQRVDGSQIVTIRDATGRVLQRVAYDKTGHGTVLIDDLQAEERVDVTKLPRVQPERNRISMENSDAALRAELAAADAAYVGRKFSLRQIRNIQEVRWLAPTIDVNNITFETGSSAIQTSEAKKLNKLGRFISQVIDQNPGAVFLIEGHTDAVGSAASNLALSDRRAESVAKALSEYFDVPPENLVVQGYGESELKIDKAGDERRNRRVSVRVITELLRQNRT